MIPALFWWAVAWAWWAAAKLYAGAKVAGVLLWLARCAGAVLYRTRPGH